MDVLGACPLDCPDGCSWVVTVEDGEAVRPARQPRAPVHRGRAVREGQRLPRAHARARPAAVPAAPRRREGRGDASSGSRGTRRWPRSPRELHAVRDEFGGEAIWPFQGTGSLGYVQGLEGRAGQRLWNVLGASRHDMTICSIAGRVGATLHHRHGGRDGPGDVRAVQADPAVGHEHAHERPSPVEVRPRGAQERRAHRRHRPAAHPHRRRRPTSTSRRCRAPTPRSRSACCT